MTIFERISELLADTPRPCLYELGACDGNETVTFSKMFPTSTIVVVEPVPDLCKIISNRHELKGRIDLVKKAIGAENGKTTLHISGGNCEVTGQNFYASSSIKTPKFAEQVFKGMNFKEVKCEVVTLDTLWSERGCGIIDFIWADIQGAEREMIEGGKLALKSTRYLFTEVGEGDYYEGEWKTKDILEALPYFELLEDFGTDILLKNKYFE